MPFFRDVTASDPVQRVLSLNLFRRHLTTSQRAMVGARAKELYEAEARDRKRTNGGDKKSEKRKSDPAMLPGPIYRGDARDKAGEDGFIA